MGDPRHKSAAVLVFTGKVRLAFRASLHDEFCAAFRARAVRIIDDGLCVSALRIVRAGKEFAETADLLDDFRTAEFAALVAVLVGEL